MRSAWASSALAATLASLAWSGVGGQAGGPGLDPGPAGHTLSARRGQAESGPRSHSFAEPPGWHGGTFPTTAGAVTVQVSDSYPLEQVLPLTWAEFFAGLPHGAELSRLVVRIAPADEVAEVCGEGALACYGRDELYMPGDSVEGVAPEELARHEYGHHLAAHRSNPPWRADEWGAKRWASAGRICPRARSRQVFPGDGAHYRLDPGEAFAEAYRMLAEQRAGAMLSTWDLVDPSFYPDAEDLRAVAGDVARPWTAPTRIAVRGRFLNGARRQELVELPTPLDGELTATLTVPGGRLDTLELLSADRRVLARGLWSGTATRRLSFLVCGERRLLLRVTRAGSPGRFTLTVARP